MIKRTGWLFVLFPAFCLADTVVPIDAVEQDVNIRLSPDASSEIVGKLEKGSSTELVNAIDGWYEVKLDGGATGFISSDWTRVVGDGVEAAVEQAAVAIAEVAANEVVAELVDKVVEESVDEAVDEAVDKTVEEAIEEAAEVDVAVAIESVVDEAATDALTDEGSVTDDTVVPEPVVEEEAEVPVAPEPPMRANLKGTKDYLVKFRNEAEGESSQIYDNGHQVGIGTTEPKQRLEVNGSIQIHEQNSSVAGLMITQSSGDTGYIMHNRASTLTIGAGSQDRITIDRNGNVGIAVSRPKHPLEMASGAHVTAGGVWTNSSSRENKENIEALQLEAATNALMALQPVVFNYKNEAGENYVGFIAEDVPELVAVADRDALSAMDIVAVLTRVVQEQEKKIQALEARIDGQ